MDIGKKRAFPGTGQEVADRYERAGKWILATIYGQKSARDWCDKKGVGIIKATSEGIGSGGGFLVPTDLERAIFARGAAHSAAIKEAKRQSLDLTPPTRAGTVTAPPAPRWSQHVRGLLFMIGRGALSPCPRPRSLSSGGAA